MSTVSYRITDLHANILPDDDEPALVRVAVSIEMGDATLDEEHNLSSGCTLEFQLYDPETFHEIDPGQDVDETDPEYGDIELQFQVDADVSPGMLDDDLNVEEEIETWNSEGYENVDSRLISHVESGFLSQLFAPLEQLLDDSVLGILPRYRFTRTTEEQEQIEQRREEMEEESGEES